MTLRLVSCLLLLLACPARAETVAAPAPAAKPMPAMVVIVDVQRILQESLAAGSVRQQLESQRAKFQQQISSEEKKLAAVEADLKKDHGKISADAYAVREQALRRQFLEVERDVQARRRALDQGFNESMSVVRSNLLDVVSALASERGANIVLLKQQALWFDQALDITDTVLGRLNDRLKTVDVKVTPAEDKKPKQN